MIDRAVVIAALTAFRARLVKAGHPLKAAAVARCILIIKRI